MINLYQNYLEDINYALKKGKKRGQIQKGFSSFDGNTESIRLTESSRVNLFESLQPLSKISGVKTNSNMRPGAHPDFSRLSSTSETENHYITSMFIDIKNSTGLFRHYTPDVVAYITTTLQLAAIHTCWYFDGYIQRFHGDGLLVYFGGKKTDIKTSVSNSIKAASFFSYFMKEDLKTVYNQQGVDKIYTRIGIDTGENDDVLWYKAGIGDCSEITTCSLHTSLAAKMQSNATNNGIVVGNNTKALSTLDNSLYSAVWNQKESREERYIFQIPEEDFHYMQWALNWEGYLKSIPGIMAGDDGKLYLDDVQEIRSKNVEYLNSKVNNYRPYSR